MNIIDIMRNSGNKLLESESADISIWQKLKHTKQDLELFLNCNIAEIKFITANNEERSIICTSNTTLIKLLSTKNNSDKNKIINVKSSGMHTNESFSVLTWDLIDNKPKTILLTAWEIVNFMTITDKNILVLDELLCDILKKR